MKMILGIVWCLLLFWSVAGLGFYFTGDADLWIKGITLVPFGIWGSWTYRLLDSKKEKTDD